MEFEGGIITTENNINREKIILCVERAKNRPQKLGFLKPGTYTKYIEY